MQPTSSAWCSDQAIRLPGTERQEATEDRLAWLMSCSSLATSTKGAHVSFFLCASHATAITAATDASASHLEIWFGLMWNPSIKTMCAAKGWDVHILSPSRKRRLCAFSLPSLYFLRSPFSFELHENICFNGNRKYPNESDWRQPAMKSIEKYPLQRL